MKYNPVLFREYDLRGVAGRDLDEEFCVRFGRAYGSFLLSVFPGRRLRVAVGRDCRKTSDAYASSLIRGLVLCGINVIDLGMCPTPVVGYAIGEFKLDGGVMVTGSHNPREYNGFKLYAGADTLHGSQIRDLRFFYEHGGFSEASVVGKHEQFDAVWKYSEFIVSQVSPLDGLSIVLDAGNGAAGRIAPEIFKRLGCRVSCLFCEPDGDFPNRDPDPSVPSSLSALCKQVVDTGSDLGIAFDGDADRIGVVDNLGRVMPADELLILLSRDVLARHPGGQVVFDVKCSRILPAEIIRYGGRPVLWKTGHSLIKAKMVDEDAVLAGELSGHIFTRLANRVTDDAILAAVRLCSILHSTSTRLSDFRDSLPRTYVSDEIRVQVPEEQKFGIVRRMIGVLGNAGQMNFIDGIRFEVGDSWALVRASNTQPMIIMRFESASSKGLGEIQDKIEKLLRETIGKP